MYTPISVSRVRRLFLVTTASVALGTLSLVAQAPATPAAAGAQTPAASEAAGRGRLGAGGGRGQVSTEPDFSKKPPVLPLRPEEEAKKFWLPAGFTMTPVLTDP
ncbi:MAG: hypothetical protein ABUL63_06180, partial [Acidobacteriota bacterium]